MLRVHEKYISASCNAYPLCCDLKNNFLCFGSSNAVAVCNFKDVPSISHMVVGHKKQVNCVKWLPCTSDEPEYMVSCSADKTFVVWKMQALRLTLLESVQAHSDSITYISPLLTSTNRLVVVTTSVDARTKVWCRDLSDSSSGAGMKLADELVTKGSLMISLSCVEMERGELLLACGSEDNKVHLFKSTREPKFTWLLALKGHSDWVRDLAFDHGGPDGWLLASASQDGYVRLWSVRSNEGELSAELFSVLAAHDGWVQSVQWLYRQGSTKALLTSSLDHSVVLWTQDQASLLWIEEERFSQGVAVMRGVAQEHLIVAQLYTGTFQVWRKLEQGDWVMRAGCGGHLGEVTDVCWSPQGEYLLSTGADKTTRLHVCVKAFEGERDCEREVGNSGEGVRKDEKISDIDEKESRNATWCQISRPQVHGHKINAITPFARFSFASGADEKVLRLFKATSLFMRSFASLTGAHVSEIPDTGVPTLPALALSNKVVSASEALQHHWKDGPPSEEWLRNALWLECEKLYGHNFEIFSLAACPSKCLLASSSKASSPDAAVILIWNTGTNTLLQQLSTHSSTVTQLSFSRHGNHLLSVSKDRTWSLFGLRENLFELLCVGRAHSRVIWACAWSHDDRYFVTASRDKKVLVWAVEEVVASGEGTPKQATGAFSASEAVTAVDFAPNFLNERYMLVLGFESGRMVVLDWEPGACEAAWTTIATLDSAHHMAVKRVCFRPGASTEVASCSEDGSVKIHSIHPA